MPGIVMAMKAKALLTKAAVRAEWRPPTKPSAFIVSAMAARTRFTLTWGGAKERGSGVQGCLQTNICNALGKRQAAVTSPPPCATRTHLVDVGEGQAAVREHLQLPLEVASKVDLEAGRQSGVQDASIL